MRYKLRARRDRTSLGAKGWFLELRRCPARDVSPDPGHAVDVGYFEGAVSARCATAKHLVASERARIEKARAELDQQLAELAKLERTLK